MQSRDGSTVEFIAKSIRVVNVCLAGASVIVLVAVLCYFSIEASIWVASNDIFVVRSVAVLSVLFYYVIVIAFVRTKYFGHSFSVYDIHASKSPSKLSVAFLSILSTPVLLTLSFVVSSCLLTFAFTSRKIFTGPTGLAHEWVLYVADNIVRSIVFDFAETYRLRISKIDYSDGVYIATHVILCRTSMALDAVSYAVNKYIAFKEYTNAIRRSQGLV